MKKINFENPFKIIVIIQLTLLILVNLLNYFSFNSQQDSEANEIGRYKEVKIKRFNIRGEEIDENVRILDTKIGKYVER
jgi:hypothetical protein